MGKADKDIKSSFNKSVRQHFLSFKHGASRGAQGFAKVAGGVASIPAFFSGLALVLEAAKLVSNPNTSETVATFATATACYLGAEKAEKYFKDLSECFENRINYNNECFNELSYIPGWGTGFLGAGALVASLGVAGNVVLDETADLIIDSQHRQVEQEVDVSDAQYRSQMPLRDFGDTAYIVVP